MPERWEHELRKLRDLEAQPGLRARIEEGPRGEGPPPTRQRVIAAVTALAVFVAAGVLAVRVFGTGPDRPQALGDGAAAAGQRLVLELSSGDDAPTATLRYGDLQQDGVTEAYTWCLNGECMSGISDFAFYPPVGEYLVVPPGTPIDVTGDGTMVSLEVTDPQGEPIAGSSSDSVPSDDGLYAIEVNASWALEAHTGEANFFFGVQTLSSPEAAPDVLHVDCSAGVARADTAVVQTRPDGLHVVVRGAEGYRELDILSPEGTPPASFAGVGGPLPESERSTWPIDPGSWEIGCFEDAGSVEAGFLTAAFELIDPADHHASVELVCNDPAEKELSSGLVIRMVDAVPVGLLDGLEAGDRFREGGYGADAFKLGPTYVVDRAGDAVARLVLPIDGAGGSFATCDSAITLTEAATSPPPEPTVPDVLVMRCEGLGPAVESETVRLQPDGLHVEATNIADAAVVALDPQDGSIEAIVHPFDAVTETIVADVLPGTLWVGCRVQNDLGEIVGGPEEVPDAYIQVTVLPAED